MTTKDFVHILNPIQDHPDMYTIYWLEQAIRPESQSLLEGKRLAFPDLHPVDYIRYPGTYIIRLFVFDSKGYIIKFGFTREHLVYKSTIEEILSLELTPNAKEETEKYLYLC